MKLTKTKTIFISSLSSFDFNLVIVKEDNFITGSIIQENLVKKTLEIFFYK